MEDNTVYHKGYPTCYRSKPSVPSIQVSATRDKTRADVDVDYKSSGFPKGLVNGHLSSSNSDVRAGRNDDTCSRCRVKHRRRTCMPKQEDQLQAHGHKPA